MELNYWIVAGIFIVSLILAFIVGFKFGVKWVELTILEYV